MPINTPAKEWDVACETMIHRNGQLSFVMIWCKSLNWSWIILENGKRVSDSLIPDADENGIIKTDCDSFWDSTTNLRSSSAAYLKALNQHESQAIARQSN